MKVPKESKDLLSPRSHIKERKVFTMKKRIVSILILCAMLVSIASLVACSDSSSAEKGTSTRMTVDINPSVEFMIDDENKVVSVTALNDDGSILIAGEAFVGKTPDEAVELMVTLAAETGYLVKGNVSADENTVKISVSGNSDYAKELMSDVRAKASDVMESLDISGKVEKVDALALDSLRALALSTSLYTEEEIAKMNEKQLYNVLKESRVETALLLTEEMRTAYYAAKEHKISFAESEETAKVIEALGGLHAFVHTAYSSALTAYSSAIESLDEFRYNMLVSPDSSYQQALSALRDSKAELLKERNNVASLEEGSEEYEEAVALLDFAEAAYDAALLAFETIGNGINTTLETLISNLKKAEEALHELEETLFDDAIEEKLAEKAKEIEASVNEAKDNFFSEFEAAHADDIAAIEEALMAKKEALKAEINTAA